MPDKTSSYPQLTPADLQDKTLFRLNASIQFLYSQIDKIQSANGRTTIKGLFDKIQSALIAGPREGGRPLQSVVGAEPKIASVGDVLDLTGLKLLAPSGSDGWTGTIQVRDAAGTGVVTITVSGGFITAVNP